MFPVLFTIHPGRRWWTFLHQAIGPCKLIFKRQGRILSEDWRRYDIAHTVFKPTGMSVEDLDEGRRWIEDEFYSFTGTLKRMLSLGKRVRYLVPMLILNTSYRQYVKDFR